MHRASPACLERSCTASPRDWIKLAPPQAGFERLEAFFAGHGYDPHRHDTYAVGLTLEGVQSFDYRGATVHSTRGQAIVLHPDEMHDGRAGTDVGFRYRIAFIEPRLVQDALGEPHSPLPFAGDAVTSDIRLITVLASALDELDAPLEPLQLDHIVVGIAEALAALDATHDRHVIGKGCVHAIGKAREFLDAHLEHAVRSEQLETITGLSRFALARHFRACLGTSPYRYLVMRRLDRARQLMLSGAPLAHAAVCSGFADQSHMTRQFKKAYGVSPGHWQRIAAGRQ